MNFDLVSWLTGWARQTLQYKVGGTGWQGQRWCSGERRNHRRRQKIGVQQSGVRKALLADWNENKWQLDL